MPSPFHQKYSSQSHKVFGDNTAPIIPEAPKDDAQRRASDASVGSSPGSPTERRRSSVNRFANLDALKRPTDDASVNRRSSFQDAYAKQGFLGSIWNNFTRGPSGPSPPAKPTEARDTSTLRQ